ncbi:MAG: MBL fold metallo-hydrolase [Bryobacteraceae bacterium]
MKHRPGDTHIVKICSLASGSTGNVTWIATDRARILVDAGLSRKETLERLRRAGEPADRIDAILISHEHGDHVAGLVPLARGAYQEKKSDVPVFMTALTARAMAWAEYTPRLEHFQAGSSFVVGDIEVSTFTIPHDALDPVGFTFQTQGIKIGVVTDLGYIPESIKVHLRNCDLLLLEANHDVEMLKVGPYPWSVKQRVMGRNGHLSNDVACDFIQNDLNTTTSTLILGHLSEHNNHPAIVRLAADQALAGRSLFTRLIIAEADNPTEVFCY